jgi:hypothetical protein
VFFLAFDIAFWEILHKKTCLKLQKLKKIVAVQATHGKGVGARQRTFAVPRRTAKKM